MADRLLYHDLAGLLGHIPNMEFGDKPLFERARKWSIYELLTSNFATRTRSLVAYVYSDATKGDLGHLRATLETNRKTVGDIIILAPPAYLDRNANFVKEAFANVSATILSSRDYLIASFRQQLERYLTEVRKGSSPYYVDPIVVTGDGLDGKGSVNAIRQFLQYPNEAKLGILLAEPGQGKTFLSGHLASTLAKSGRVPLYVNSDQWKKLVPEDLESIWKAMTQSFNAHGARISWIDGIEEQFISICLKADLFAIIFDGFDEFILRNAGRVDAVESLNALLDLQAVSGARILVTARSSFWNSEVAPRLSEATDINLFYLRPFDQRGANSYFAKRFPHDKAKASQAELLFSELSSTTTKHGVNFVGRGFFLYHIADLVERDLGTYHLDMGKLTSTQWIAAMLCERDRTRQNLPLEVDQQLSVLSELAYFLVTGAKTDTESLRAIVFNAAPKLPAKQIDELLGVPKKARGTLMDHPLLEFDDRSQRWRFRQEQLGHVFVAERLFDLAMAASEAADNESMVVLEQLANLAKGIGIEFRSEIASTVIEHILEINNFPDAERKIRTIIASIVDAVAKIPDAAADMAATYLATAIGMAAVNQLFPSGASKGERTQFFVGLYPFRAPAELSFTGTIKQFDFSGLTFSRCTFSHVTWVGCKFDSQTIFDGCRFEGGAIASCDQFGVCQWTPSCVFDRESLSLIESEQARLGRKYYRAANLRADIEGCLKKFITAGASSLKSVEERNLGGGKIAQSPYKDEIIDAFKKHLIEQDKLSSQGRQRFRVRDEAMQSLIHFAQNGVFSGRLQRVADEPT